jgi:hypothetical protein
VAGRCRVSVCALALGAGSLAGCGSSASSSTSTVTYHPLQPPSRHRVVTRPRVNPHSPRVGTTQHVATAGTKLSVTVTSVTDPLQDSHAALVPGTRAVGVMAEVSNDGPGGYDSSSTGDFSVVPSSGAATPVFASAGLCQTPLRDWDNEIGPGQTRTGCVVFAVPARARLLGVRFSPHASRASRATWLVPHA